jgi:hypothetical protein
MLVILTDAKSLRERSVSTRKGKKSATVSYRVAGVGSVVENNTGRL